MRAAFLFSKSCWLAYLSHVYKLLLSTPPIIFFAYFSTKNCWYLKSYSASFGSFFFFSYHSYSSKTYSFGRLSSSCFSLMNSYTCWGWVAWYYLSMSRLNLSWGRLLVYGLTDNLPLLMLYCYSIDFIECRWASSFASMFSRLITSRLDLTWVAVCYRWGRVLMW